MRIRWTNKIDIVDGFLEIGNLVSAKEMALQILKSPEAGDMLSEDEIEYLKIVVALNKIDDIVNGHGELT